MSVVLITGCSSGFGLETALAFARRGDTTYATMRDLSKSAALVERAKDENLAVELLELDVTDDDSVAHAIGEVESRHGAIDVLVNNAGVDYTGSVETIDVEHARAVMETNFWGPVRTIRAVLPAMRRRGDAVIVNVSSVVSQLPGTPYGSWYSASKHALNALTEAMYIELDGFGVRVASIEPGFFKTEINRSSRARAVIDESDPYAPDQAWLATFFEKGAATGGDPADVAEAIVRVAADRHAPVHILLGEDASTMAALAKDAGTIEEWRRVAVSLAESIAGPRPPR